MGIYTQSIVGKINESLDKSPYSIRQFSQKVGISETTIHKILKGKQSITIETIESIANALEVPIISFFEDIKIDDLQTVQLKERIYEQQRTIDLYSNLIDNTAETLKIIWFLSQFVKGIEIPQNILENQDNSIKFISEFNKYTKVKQDEWVRSANKNLEEMEEKEREKQKELIRVRVWQIPIISKLFAPFARLLGWDK